MNNINTFWHKEPFVRLLLCLVLGIIPALYIPWYIYPLLAGIIVLSIIALVYITYYIDRNKTYIGFALMISTTVLGFIITRVQDDGVTPNSINNIKQQATYITGYIYSDVDIKNEKEYAVVSVTQYIDTAGKQHVACGKMLIYVPAPAGLKYGQDICIDAHDIHDVFATGNPFEFDYKSYFYKQHIYAVAFTKRRHIILGKVNHINVLKATAFKFNQYALAQLKTYITDKEARGIEEALLIGYRANIDASTVQAYTDCGVIHVMAVSGTQVALIYLLIEAVFFMFKSGKQRNIWQWLTTLIFIWVFTAMAGFSGSVVRAAVMFTLISYARYLNRYTGIYNMLAASAFIIFLFDAYAITDVGLQLSYVAVWGIVFLNRKIYTTLTINNKMMDNAWRLICVSISAQVATLPLLLYYFRQFPLFFIPANLLAIPITTITLYAGISIVCFGSIIPFISKGISFIITLLIHVLDNYLVWLQHGSWAVIYTRSYSILEAVIWAALLVSAWVFIIYKYRVALYFSLATLFVLVTFNSYYAISNKQRNEIVILNTGYKKAYCLVCRDKALLVCDTSSLKNKYFFQNYFPKYARSAGISNWKVTTF